MSESDTKANITAILLVEDEEALLSLESKILTGKGFRVWTAKDGREALEVLNGIPYPVDVAIIDVGLPKLSGHEVAERIKAGSPNTALIFTSGYLIEHPEQVTNGFTRCRFVQKPFPVQDLGKMVGEILAD